MEIKDRLSDHIKWLKDQIIWCETSNQNTLVTDTYKVTLAMAQSLVPPAPQPLKAGSEAFHITWYPKSDSIYCTGVTFHSQSMKTAIADFREVYGVTPLNVVSINELQRNEKHSIQSEEIDDNTDKPNEE